MDYCRKILILSNIKEKYLKTICIPFIDASESQKRSQQSIHLITVEIKTAGSREVEWTMEDYIAS